MSTVPNVFSDDEVIALMQLPATLDARARLGTQGTVSFTVPLTDPVRASLQTHLGLDLAAVSQLPMRWIQGDTPAHVDTGSSTFDHTYLVYLNDSPGQFILDQDAYPIEANTAFIFSEGVHHRTQNTGDLPRLLVGPMNEMADPVGGIPITYYNNYADALAQNGNTIAISNSSYVLGTVSSGSIGAYTSWLVASTSPPSAPPVGPFSNGFDLSVYGGSSYFVYPSAPCFKEGTRVLALVDGKETYVPIETLKKGDLVTTSHHGHKKVEVIGSGVLHNPGTLPGTSEGRSQHRLYRCSPARYGDLKTDLYVTGGHAILVDSLTAVQRAQTIKELGRVFATDGKARLLACIDERAEPAGPAGPVPIWHLALEHENPKMNYGIYVNGGLLVETCCIDTLKHRSNMTTEA